MLFGHLSKFKTVYTSEPPCRHPVIKYTVNASGEQIAYTNLKQPPNHAIQNVPFGLATDSNAAYEEGARPWILNEYKRES